MTEAKSEPAESGEQSSKEKRNSRKQIILYFAILIAISVLSFFVYRIYDFVCICRIPPGTAVVDTRSVSPYNPALDGLFRSGKYPKLLPYLMYRHYVIPEGVTEIGERAFRDSGCLLLRSVAIPGSVKKIGRYAFAECRNLTAILIPEGVETIEPFAFTQCFNLKRVELPDSLKTIGGGAFAACTSLEKIRIPDGVKKIGLGAFAGCIALADVELPPGIKEIGSGAFSSCAALADIELPPGVNVAPNAFEGTHLPPEKKSPPKQPQTETED